ncbi:hypothetical protein DFP72DRAFT_893976 [Ephemerocybe angulata]|uniref:Uncharacterized protein n=1 Tax=Ephemerocybe angulata TaxID=980116 RepID=A0A8H6M800_9AGAR|nr:hypothetical protein DFP72DRAFT_893976 [Tulosesus angulatus]
MKTPGRDDDDDLEEVEDDAVNPSPLFHRRRAQYKSTAPSLSAATRRRISSGGTSLNSRSPAMPRYASPTSSPPIAALFENPRAGAAAGEDENPRKAFLRERFKKTYFARATKAREEAVRKRRRRVEGLEGMGSDEEMEEEGDEAILNDVLFARIMASLNKKQERAYRISYAREVGSSFDPDLEDVSRWEQELSGAPLPPTSFSNHPASPHRPSPYQSTSTGNNSSGFPSNGGGSSPPRPPTEYEYGDDGEGYGHGEEDFVGLEEAEIEAYAEEYARAVEGREAEAASASGSSSGTGAHSSGTGAHSSGTGAQQGQGQGAGQGDVANLLEGLEDLPEEELFGVWNWDDGDEMDLS